MASVPDYPTGVIQSIDDLEDWLSRPSAKLVDFMNRLDGDIGIFGAGGKMGSSLVKLAARALQSSTNKKSKLYAVSRFSSSEVRTDLERHSVAVIQVDLLDEEKLNDIPDIRNVILMAGQKFGTSGNEYSTWATNTYLAGRIAEKYRNSKIVAFSTGNIYPMVSPESGGATEDTPPSPIGEYAQSRLASERILEFFSRKYGTPISVIRLNYSVELRYGVLHDIGQMVLEEKPIDLRMGWVNVIWQRDANDIAVRSLDSASSPPTVFNVTGDQCASVRQIALRFGKIFGKEVRFSGNEGDLAFLSNSSKSDRIFGRSNIAIDRIIELVADWLASGRASLGKPTHFQESKGNF